jgi:predicted PurR-regulated permease PerM
MIATPSTRPVGLVDRQTAKILFTILLFAAILGVVYVARAVLVLFAFAILLAYLINPVVRFLQRRSFFFKNLRGPHVAEAYLTFLFLAPFLIHAFIPELHRHPARVIGNARGLVERVSSEEIVDDLASSFGWSETQTVRARSFVEQHKSEIESFRETAEHFLSVVLSGLVVIPILALSFSAMAKSWRNRWYDLFRHQATTKRSNPWLQNWTRRCSTT